MIKLYYNVKENIEYDPPNEYSFLKAKEKLITHLLTRERNINHVKDVFSNFVKKEYREYMDFHEIVEYDKVLYFINFREPLLRVNGVIHRIFFLNQFTYTKFRVDDKKIYVDICLMVDNLSNIEFIFLTLCFKNYIEYNEFIKENKGKELDIDRIDNKYIENKEIIIKDKVFIDSLFSVYCLYEETERIKDFSNRDSVIRYMVGNHVSLNYFLIRHNRDMSEDRILLDRNNMMSDYGRIDLLENKVMLSIFKNDGQKFFMTYDFITEEIEYKDMSFFNVEGFLRFTLERLDV